MDEKQYLLALKWLERQKRYADEEGRMEDMLLIEYIIKAATKRKQP